MALSFSTTKDLAALHGVKICIHARAGMGKTHIIRTLHEWQTTGPTLVINTEAGMLTLGDIVIPAITLHSYKELEEAYNFVAHSQHAAQFRSIALDSISEIGEVCLVDNKALHKDGRKAYGEMGDDMRKMIRKFRDLPGRHVYFSAKQSYNKDEVTGVSRYGPSMPGNSLTQDMPYFFDELFCLEVGNTPEGQKFRYLRTDADLRYEAKDRSGALAPFEEPHLGKVIDKILAAKRVA